jgi:hypothetical protein
MRRRINYYMLRMSFILYYGRPVRKAIRLTSAVYRCFYKNDTIGISQVSSLSFQPVESLNAVRLE